MSASIFSPLEDCHGDDAVSPSAGQKDIYVQLVLSLGLGVSSFVAFCVSPGGGGVAILAEGLTIDAAVAPALEGAVCGKEATDGCCGDAARAAGWVLWVDAGAVSGDGGAGAGVCGAGCVCGMCDDVSGEER